MHAMTVSSDKLQKSDNPFVDEVRPPNILYLLRSLLFTVRFRSLIHHQGEDESIEGAWSPGGDLYIVQGLSPNYPDVESDQSATAGMIVVRSAHCLFRIELHQRQHWLSSQRVTWHTHEYDGLRRSRLHTTKTTS